MARFLSFALAPVLACILGLSCGGAAMIHPHDPGPMATDEDANAVAAVGVTDPDLAALLRDHWQWVMETEPVWATTLGDHRYDDRISDPSAAQVERDKATRAQLLERARQLGDADLDPTDRLTYELFVGQLEADVGLESCELHLWSVSARGNPVTDFGSLSERHKVENAEDGANLLSRYRAMAGSVDAQIANLRTGLERGLVANAESVRRTVELVDRELAKPVVETALLLPTQTRPAAWDEASFAAWSAELRNVVEQEIRPAFARYRDALRDEILPRGRTGNEVGVGALPGGAACYKARVRHYTGLDLDPDELHQLGLDELEKIHGEMRELDRAGGHDRDLAAIIEALRTNPDLYYTSAEEIVADAEKALAAAKAAMPKFFGRLPVADCEVVPIPDYEAPYTTIAYYREPHADGSKPGQYFINTHEPETRPRFEMQVLTWHESIPGHHLQIAIAQELTDLPAFRRFLGSTAFVEGWGLYTERLADEMGLYSSDVDRIGMLSYDAWRASRLVVDTGIHVKGWSRDQAVEFMKKNTALTDTNINNEVDRYISWPGQALAYKVGQLEILRLRAMAEEALEERFSLPEFHDVVLGSGAVTLPVLRRQTRRWIESAGSREP